MDERKFSEIFFFQKHYSFLFSLSMTHGYGHVHHCLTTYDKNCCFDQTPSLSYNPQLQARTFLTIERMDKLLK